MQKEMIKLDEESLIWYYPNFLSSEDANDYYNLLLKELDWHKEQIKLFGKTFWQPRLLAWYGDEAASYSYSGIIHQPKAWTPSLRFLKSKIENISGGKFNAVLANQYRDGQDSMGWHSDDEKELGTAPLIASLSLGATRRLRFRSRLNKEAKKHSIDLSTGSLLLMGGMTQENWQHMIPKTTRKVGIRINLTFRWINT